MRVPGWLPAWPRISAASPLCNRLADRETGGAASGHADLFGDRAVEAAARLVATVLRILGGRIVPGPRRADSAEHLTIAGDRLLESGRTEKAERWYRRAADAGYHLAMVHLAGLLLQSGRTVEAEQWYRRAADVGYDLAMVHLARLLLESGRADEAERWYRRAADAGSSMAMDELGDLLLRSRPAEETGR